MGKTATAAAAVLIPLLGLVGTSVAQAQSRQTFELRYTAERPASPTGFQEEIEYVNPDDPDAKPPAVATVVLRLARGATVDTSVPQRCPAADPVLLAQGPSACPDGSRVGRGEVTLDTGASGPGRLVQTTVTLLNNEDELIFLFEEEDSGARSVSRAQARDRRFVTEVPPLPGGPPDGFTSIKRVQLNVRPASGRDGEAYITTPETCPASGHWTNAGVFTYRDGVRQSVKSSTACSARGHDRPRVTCRGMRVTLHGTRRDDAIRGTRRRDVIGARGGDDAIRARGGNDVICAGRGDDRVRGGRGRDRIHGGGGSDHERGGRGSDRCGGGAHDRKRSCERGSRPSRT